MFSLKDRIALVTGASRGLGWAIAQSLAQAGATVLLNGRDAESLQARQAELERRGLRAEACGFDVTDHDACAAYIASKGAVHALVRELAIELGPQGITVNAIAPGYFATELNTALVQNEEFNAWICKRTTVGRWGRAEEIGAAAVYLASDEAAYVNGHILAVDSGFSAAM